MWEEEGRGSTKATISTHWLRLTTASSKWIEVLRENSKHRVFFQGLTEIK